MINCVSWLDDYRALQDSPACVVVPIDKLSVLVIVLFSALVLREAVSPDSWRLSVLRVCRDLRISAAVWVSWG